MKASQIEQAKRLVDEHKRLTEFTRRLQHLPTLLGVYLPTTFERETGRLSEGAQTILISDARVIAAIVDHAANTANDQLRSIEVSIARMGITLTDSPEGA